MSRRRYSMVSGINEIIMTPLIDMTFLLLIVFVVTPPMLEYVVNVSPPKMTADRPEDPDNILITITNRGEIQLERKTLTLAQVALRLAELKAGKPDAAVLIRADADRAYREVIGMMRVVKAAGFTNLALVTAPEDDER